MQLQFEVSNEKRTIPIAYTIYDTTLEMIIDNANDSRLFGHQTLEDFHNHYTKDDAMELLTHYPESIEMVEGGRLDILIRTPYWIQLLLLHLTYTGDPQPLYLQLADELLAADADSSEVFNQIGLYAFSSVDDALNFYGWLRDGGPQ